MKKKECIVGDRKKEGDDKVSSLSQASYHKRKNHRRAGGRWSPMVRAGADVVWETGAAHCWVDGVVGANKEPGCPGPLCE